MKTRTLMVQGTTSDAGKSTLVTALGRALWRRGFRVAPFKPQNMALNAAVTADGGEIGRAQAVQAQACGLEPHTDMNPVLLKPTTDRAAQVILQGRAIGNLDAMAYQAYKGRARAAVLESYARLSAQYDIVLVEGAGSPAEINLREGDIANMGFAEAVDCPVILVADIDRGGVFAHLVGTLALLSPSERARVKGFVINRFRGDLALLKPGLDWLQRETGKPVLGVLPYLHGLHIDAEDAIPRLTSKEALKNSALPVCGRRPQHEQGRKPLIRGDCRGHVPRRGELQHFPKEMLNKASHGFMQLAPSRYTPGTASEHQQLGVAVAQAGLRVAVPILPRISNHTDLDPLRHHPDVELRLVGPGEPIPPADLIILPGSKSVRADLAFLRAQGWEEAIRRHLRYGGKVIGLCGGYQMLGQSIHDPHGIEGEPGTSAGLGWLEIDTVLEPQKQLRRVAGRLVLDDAPLEGYEIHAGITHGSGLARPTVLLEHGPDGAISADGQVLGSYVHGLFDHPAACAALLAWAGLKAAGAPPDLRQLREQGIERLADCVEEHLAMERIIDILESRPCPP